ncbi:hypothetical protein G9A89_008221 [Geosiphon pyriformis]|nr:hypothetical protein G9A89_008221 [Geosiphon pyriformis]
MQAPATYSHFKTTNVLAPLIELEKETKITGRKPITIASLTTTNVMAIQKDKTSGTMNYVLLATNNCSIKECRTIFLVEKKYAMLCANTQSLSVIG